MSVCKYGFTFLAVGMKGPYPFKVLHSANKHAEMYWFQQQCCITSQLSSPSSSAWLTCCMSSALLYCNCLFVDVLLGAVKEFRAVASDRRVWLLGLYSYQPLKSYCANKGYNFVLLWFYLFAVVVIFLLSFISNASDS